MSIQEFWELTPSEIALIAEAKNLQREDQMYQLAWAVSYIISYTGRLKRPVPPSKLLPQRQDKKPKRIENKQQEWEEIKKMFGGE